MLNKFITKRQRWSSFKDNFLNLTNISDLGTVRDFISGMTDHFGKKSVRCILEKTLGKIFFSETGKEIYIIDSGNIGFRRIKYETFPYYSDSSSIASSSSEDLYVHPKRSRHTLSPEESLRKSTPRYCQQVDFLGRCISSLIRHNNTLEPDVYFVRPLEDGRSTCMVLVEVKMILSIYDHDL